MSWAIKVNDVEFKLDDIPIVKLQPIATKHGLWWRELLRFPLTDALAYIELLALIAEMHPDAFSQEVPGIDGSAGSIDKLADLLVAVDEDEVTEWEDGAPLEEPAPETNG